MTFPCASCGKTISGYPCVFCRMRGQGEKTHAGVVFAGIFVALLALVAVCVPMLDRMRESDTAPPPEILGAHASHDGQTLTLESRDGYAWGPTEISLNDGLFRGGFTLRINGMQPGGRRTFRLTEFAAPDGQRFNPATHHVNSISLVAQTPHGKLVWAGAFEHGP